MSRARLALTLVLVALAAMLVGLTASVLVTRHLAARPDPSPETEPARPSSAFPAYA